MTNLINITVLGKRFLVTGPMRDFTENMIKVIKEPDTIVVDKLIISDTDLKKIDTFPEVAELTLNYNSELKTIPEIPHNTEEFQCSNSEINSIPEFEILEASELKNIQCNDNKLTHLPKLPQGIYHVDAHNNNIKLFPNLPTGIATLYLSGNPFTKNIKEVRKMVEYVVENECDSDIDDIIDLKTYRAMKIATKTGTIGKPGTNNTLPQELQEVIKSYSLAGNKTKRKKKRKKKTEKKKTEKKKRKPKRKSN